jgi:hypothetical protein
VIVPNRRYHIHVVCADNDQLLVLDSIAIFFQGRAFLTYDVSSKLPKASLYGRQCIDACDYVLMVISDSYGTAHNTGVSQMHLSYLNAKAKLKPLLILVKKHHNEANISRQLQAFTGMVTSKEGKIYYYETEIDIEQLLIQAYYKMVGSHQIAAGWIRTTEELLKSSKPSVSEVLAATLAHNKIINQENTVISNQSMDDNVSKQIVLTDMFEIQYKAQAYEGGNLTDVTSSMVLTWQDLLLTLIKMPATFSSYGLQSWINRLIAIQAEIDIKLEMPNVHAVARCQISQDDINYLQQQLVAANWIQLTTYDTRVTQDLWKLTFHAKKILVDKKSATESPSTLTSTS